jgi:hypothetical protein
MAEESSTPATGAARVQALLAATMADLSPLAAAPQAADVIAAAAREAVAELGRVSDWLRASAPGQPPRPAGAGQLLPAPAVQPPSPAEIDAAAGLVAVLRAAIDGLEALGEALEHDDPVGHFDAVQATSLATAVLESAHLRLLRTGLAQPRPVNLLAP